jgi:hypothetical protein
VWWVLDVAAVVDVVGGVVLDGADVDGGGVVDEGGVETADELDGAVVGGGVDDAALETGEVAEPDACSRPVATSDTIRCKTR